MSDEFPSSWQIAPLETVMSAIIDYRGKSPRKTTSGVPLITAKIIKAGRILEPEEFIAEADYDSWMRRGHVRAGDVVITTEAPLGEVAQLPNERIALAQRVIVLRGHPDRLDNTFLKYLLRSPFVREQLSARQSGTTVMGIRQSELRQVRLPLPSMSEQQDIAGVLSALDDGFDLNRRMNLTLEALASALFRSWFVDFDPVVAKASGRHAPGVPRAAHDLMPYQLDEIDGIPLPRGWRPGTVGEEFEVRMGQSPPGSSYNEEGSGIPFFQGCTDFGFRFPTRRLFTTAAQRFANPEDTLVSVRAPVGRTNIAAEHCCIGRGLAAVRHRSGARSYTYYSMRALEERFSVFEGEGTLFGAITRDGFANLPVLVPPSAIVDEFERTAGPLDDQLALNERENVTLADLRDTLLPELLSGRVRVRQAEKLVEAVV